LSPKPPSVLLVAGARPNFVKVAPILVELERSGSRVTLVHTGQHYTAELSDNILRDIELREPDFNLGVGSASHAVQTARVMEAFEPVLVGTRPDWVVVVGDVNSTLACALVTAKLKPEIGARLAHVEAGLRSGDWRMPEEINRVLTDRLSDLLFTPSHDAAANLSIEGIPADRVVFAGNVMIDSLLTQLDRARALGMPETVGVAGAPYAVVTLHRPSNVDSGNTLKPILDALCKINKTARVVLPMHPRTRKNAAKFGFASQLAELLVLESLGYLEMLSLVEGAAVVLTDSGGLQEETTVLGVPCVTLREQTERPITVSQGTNRMAPWPLTVVGIYESFSEAFVTSRFPVGARSPDGWDGSASKRIVAGLSSRF
jgi:UDP-N-acetylglucosamine 2-epimerase (non-hydrolysing)